MQCNAIQCNTMQYIAKQCNTIQCKNQRVKISKIVFEIMKLSWNAWHCHPLNKYMVIIFNLRYSLTSKIEMSQHSIWWSSSIFTFSCSTTCTIGSSVRSRTLSKSDQPAKTFTNYVNWDCFTPISSLILAIPHFAPVTIDAGGRWRVPRSIHNSFHSNNHSMTVPGTLAAGL